jgi:hypothetical protein
MLVLVGVLCRYAVSVVFALSAFAADDTALLSRARDRIAAMVNRAPRYTCSLSIARAYYRPSVSAHFRSCAELMKWRDEHSYLRSAYSKDRLRLDVTLAEGREIFGWPGSGAFDRRDLPDMLAEGPVGTGSYIGYLSNIFEPNSIAITYTGRRDLNGRTLNWYKYDVPITASRHHYRAGNEWPRVAFDGTFALDPETADLIYLTIRIADPPQRSGNCETSGELTYSLIQTQAGEFLTPSRATQHFTNLDVYEAENLAVYTGCREFSAASSLSFGHPAAGPAAAAATTGIAAPDGRPVDLELVAAIDTATASAGDTFAARVVQPIRDRRGTVLVPAGALVYGHLTRVQQDILSNLTTVVFQPERLRTDDGSLALGLIPRSKREYVWGTASSNGKPLPYRAQSLGEIPYPNERQLGVYHFRGAGVVVPTGFRTEWLTGKE